MKKQFLFIGLMLISLVANAQFTNPYSTPNSTINSSKATNGSYNTKQSPITTNSNVRYQEGYTRSDGTVVQGHYKTKSNSTNIDNFSTKGNTNPYTGQKGSRAQDYSPDAQNYGSGKTIHTGPRGGQYYYNSAGNKVYVPKR